MSKPAYLAVIPPPPSFDPKTYKPFGEEFDRTIDRILSEDANFDSKDEDFPVYSGGESAGTSNHPTPSDSNVEKSRFFPESPSMSGKSTTMSPRRTPRTVARRDITVIHLDSDDEEDADLTGLLDMQEVETEKAGLGVEVNWNDDTNQVEDSQGGEDGPSYSTSNDQEANISDEEDDDEETTWFDASQGVADGPSHSISDHQEASLSDEENNDEEINRVEALQEGMDGPSGSISNNLETNLSDEGHNNERTDSFDDSEGVADGPHDSNSNNDGILDNTNSVDASEEVADGPHDSKSNNDGIFEIATNHQADDPVAAEEDMIFGSLEPSRRDELLYFVASHSFMQNREVPVRRSVRRQFVNDIRRAAISAGMDESAVDALIFYVRKLYLENMSVQAEATEDAQDLRFGEEIDDEHIERTRRRKSRKRSLSNPQQPEPARRKKSKGSRKNSIEGSVPTSQLLPQTEIPTAPKKVGPTAQNPPRSPAHGAYREPEVIAVHDTPDFVSHVEYPAQAVEEVQHEPQEDLELSNQQHEADNLDAKQSVINNPKPTDLPPALEKAPTRKDGLHGQQLGHASPDLTIGLVHDSQPSEPDLLPVHEQATRPLSSHRNEQAGEQPKERTGSSNILERNAAHNVVIDMTRDSPSPGRAVPSEFANRQLPAVFNPDASGHDRRQPQQSNQSTDRVEQDVSQPIRPDLFDSAPELEQSLDLEQRWKKERNYRKKKRNKRKKRQSFLEDPSESKADQPAERQHTPVQCQSQTVPTTPPSRTSNRSRRFGPLSPNPAEWEMDF